jgi:acetyltransferase-like isoleucine patch superfamily enzyme
MVYKMFYICRLIIFYLTNCLFFKKLDFKAVVIKPLRIEGKKYITIKKKAVVKNFGWLMAQKNDAFDPELIIGEGSSIGDFCHIAAVRKVEIGKKVLMANKVYISDNLHSFDDINVPVIDQPVIFKNEVIIGDGSWLGENVCVIGAKIGQNCVIGANAVVTGDIPDYSIAVGSPAKVIKKYSIKTKKWEKV